MYLEFVLPFYSTAESGSCSSGPLVLQSHGTLLFSPLALLHLLGGCVLQRGVFWSPFYLRSFDSLAAFVVEDVEFWFVHQTLKLVVYSLICGDHLSVCL